MKKVWSFFSPPSRSSAGSWWWVLCVDWIILVWVVVCCGVTVILHSPVVKIGLVVVEEVDCFPHLSGMYVVPAEYGDVWRQCFCQITRKVQVQNLIQCKLEALGNVFQVWLLTPETTNNTLRSFSWDRVVAFARLKYASNRKRCVLLEHDFNVRHWLSGSLKVLLCLTRIGRTAHNCCQNLKIVKAQLISV